MRDGVLVDGSGRTLYTFDKDAPGKSNCTGGCLAAWPAFTAKPEAAASGEFGLGGAAPIGPAALPHRRPLTHARVCVSSRRNGLNAFPFYLELPDSLTFPATRGGKQWVWTIATTCGSETAGLSIGR
jgi:hypothetical protein